MKKKLLLKKMNLKSILIVFCFFLCTSSVMATSFGETYNSEVNFDNKGTLDETGSTDHAANAYAAPVADFYLAANNVTCMCPDAAVGDTGVANGITYTKRTKAQITEANAATTCTSGITNMSALFYDKRFNEDISSWDVSSVTNMVHMFNRANNFNQDISSWDVSSVTTMQNMFIYALAFNQPVGDWDVSKVTTMAGMFHYAQAFNQPVGDWDVSQVTTMAEMFYRARDFNQPVGNWDVSNVTNMDTMFKNARDFNQPIGDWDVSSVTNMNRMLGTTIAFNQPIGDWDVSNVTSMYGMLAGAFVFNQPIGLWDVSSLTDAGSMLSGTSAFNQPIGDWDVSNVTNMGGMFSHVRAFNQPLGDWDVSKVTTMTSMFRLSPSFNGDIGNWDVSSVTNMYYMFGGAAVFNQPIGDWDVSNVTTMEGMFSRAKAFNQAIDDWDVSKVTTMEEMFSHTLVFNQPIGAWDVSKVTMMKNMFLETSVFNQPIGDWDVSSVRSMQSMFGGARAFNEPIGDWDVSSVGMMYRMFIGAIFNQPIGDWNVSSVTNMSGMFRYASHFNQPIGDWDVSSVTGMNYMFDAAMIFNQDIGDWEVSKVSGMEGMFKNARAFNQDIGDWDVSKVTGMYLMFNRAYAFNQDIGDWDVSEVTTMVSMFHFAPVSSENYDKLLIGWSTLEASETKIPKGIRFDAAGRKYGLTGLAARNILTNAPYNWIIRDGGPLDVTPPVIIAIGDNPQTILLGDAYTELNATATDNVDGDISGNIIIDITNVNIAVIGTYLVKYNVSDKTGNPAIEVTRTVIVRGLQDITPPVARAQDITVQLDASGNATITAVDIDNGSSDDSGGTLNYTLDVTTFDCTNIGATNTVILTVTDAAGNIATATANVTILELFKDSIDLRSAASFEVFTGTGAITNSGTLTGDVGTNAGVLTGFSGPNFNGNLHFNDGLTAQVEIDLLKVYIHLNNIFETHPGTHAPAFGNGETITPGVYSIGGAGSVAGTLTLDGQGDSNAVFIIKFKGAFTAGAATNINLINGADAANVYWIAQGALSVGAASTIKGTLLAYPGAITLGVNSSIEGRLLSSVGAITIAAGGSATMPGAMHVPINPMISYTPAAAVDVLGSIENFSLFTSNGAVANASTSGILGDVGADIGAITGFATSAHVGSFYNADAVTAQAKIDLNNAYDQLMLIPNTVSSHTPAFGSGETLPAGVYTTAGAGSLAGTITLDGAGDEDAIFIFKFNGAFAAAAQSRVILSNGTRRCNVFWISEGATSIGSFSTIKGTIIAHNGAATMGAGGNLEGRLLSTGGAIGFSTGVVYTVVHDVECDYGTAVKTSVKKAVDTEITSFEEALLVYPNPSKGIFNIKLSMVDIQTDIYLFDTTGKLIARKSISKENNSGNLIRIGNYNLSSGIYLVKIITKHKAVTKKVIVETNN